MGCIIGCFLPTYYEEDMELLDANEGEFVGVYCGREVHRRHISGSAICFSILYAAGGTMFAGLAVAGQVTQNISGWGAFGMYAAAGALFVASGVQLVVSRHFIKE